jgi:hypothetical protein
VDCTICLKGFYVVLADMTKVSHVSATLMAYARKKHNVSMVATIMKNENAIVHEISANSGEVRIMNYVDNFRVLSMTDTCPTVTQIACALDLPQAYVHRIVTSKPDYYYWRSGIAGPMTDPVQHVSQCQYVLGKNVSIVVPGEKFEGGVDGMSWAEILSEIGHVKQYYSRSRRVFSLVRFLEQNLYKVHLQRELDGHSAVRLVIVSPWS